MVHVSLGWEQDNNGGTSALNAGTDIVHTVTYLHVTLGVLIKTIV